MDKKKRKREIIIKIGDLYEGHKDLSFVSMTNCRCEVCKEIRSLGQELDSLCDYTFEEVKTRRKFKTLISWKDGAAHHKVEFKSIIEAAKFIRKGHMFFYDMLDKGVTNFKVGKYQVKIKTLEKKYKKRDQIEEKESAK
ncbi:hypothetical protein [Brochothrix thermosphacta]|uniref:hypothetical protein n=1 Tax=Brochothrix thermosphacta TaxID=2756 RepID=UPI00083F9335|nr:hypothetical protein [Brochothrix thermosphacta]ODJ73360.1 hypothetical protein BFR39_03300 [Brochothrix thermosphacta]